MTLRELSGKDVIQLKNGENLGRIDDLAFDENGGRLQSDRYLVWQEDGANDFDAGGVHAEKAVTGSTDLFTKQEFDPWRDELEAAFDAAGLVWALNSCQFEEETGFWHYEWDWEVFA